VLDRRIDIWETCERWPARVCFCVDHAIVVTSPSRATRRLPVPAAGIETYDGVVDGDPGGR